VEGGKRNVMAVERQRGVSAFTIVWFGVMVSGGDGGIVPRMLVMTQQLSASSKIIQTQGHQAGWSHFSHIEHVYSHYITMFIMLLISPGENKLKSST
jgi:hypothetical protein